MYMCSYWFGKDAGGGGTNSSDHMLLHEGQRSREILSEPSQVHLGLLVVQLTDALYRERIIIITYFPGSICYTYTVHTKQ